MKFNFLENVKNTKDKDNFLIETLGELKDLLTGNDPLQNIKEKFLNLFKKENGIFFDVLSKVQGNKYTLLTYENDGIKVLKVPNILLPDEINSRTVLNYENGSFTINKKATKENDKKWELAQASVKEKDGNIYMIEELADDYVLVRDFESGDYFDLQSINYNLLMNLQEGDFVQIQDGAAVKYNGKIEVKSDEALKEILEKLNKVELDNERDLKNLEEGSIHVVNKVDNEHLALINVKDGDLFHIHTYDSEYEISSIKESGAYDDIHKVSKEDLAKMQKGTCVIVENGRYVPYDGTFETKNENALERLKKLYEEIENEKNNESQLTKGEKITSEKMKQELDNVYEKIEERKNIMEKSLKEDATHMVESESKDNIYLINLQEGYEFTLEKSQYPNFKVGDFIKVSEKEYLPYEGEVNIGNKEILDRVGYVYNHFVEIDCYK